MESLVTQLVIHLVRTYSTAANPLSVDKEAPRSLTKPQVDRAMELIHDTLGAPLSVKDLAQAMHVSPFHFGRLFKQATGLPSHQYLVRPRLELAKHLLVDCDMSIAEVAMHTGFYDKSHFSHHFKRACGVTPAIFRNRKNLPKS
jgi:AraC family transcriptional regulator